jgi:hypothetical protein
MVTFKKVMMEELHSEGKWWLPGSENQPLIGNLAFNRQDTHGTLSVYGSFSGITEADIILGELSDGQEVTLHKCIIERIYPYLGGFQKSSIKVQTILLGSLFDTPNDITFSSIYVRYRGDQINWWIKEFHTEGLFCLDKNEQPDKKEYSIKYFTRPSFKMKINEIYNITILSKPRLSKSEAEVRERSIKEEPGIEIQSLKEEKKSLEDYFEVHRIVLDFLNFIIPEEVTTELLCGIRQKKSNKSKGSISSPTPEEEVKIFYSSVIPGMFKPDIIDRPLFPRDILQDSIQVLFEKYIKKWFELSNTPVINLYCAIMFNPKRYMEYLFLGLAQAIESYHADFLETESQARKELQKGFKEIKQALPDKSDWLDNIFKDCYRRPYVERVRDVYQQYSGVCDQLFEFNDENKFSQIVKDTRHYLTHWAKDLEKKAAKGHDLVFLTKNLQVLIQLCIMTLLGFPKEDIEKIYQANTPFDPAIGRGFIHRTTLQQVLDLNYTEFQQFIKANTSNPLFRLVELTDYQWHCSNQKTGEMLARRASGTRSKNLLRCQLHNKEGNVFGFVLNVFGPGSWTDTSYEQYAPDTCPQGFSHVEGSIKSVEYAILQLITINEKGDEVTHQIMKVQKQG